MSDNIVPMKQSQLPAELDALLGGSEILTDLSEGVTGGFAVVSIRGSKWRIKKGGEEEPVLNADGDPVPSLEVVILKGSPSISKVFYKEQFTEGSDAEPDCTSIDGIKPDAGCASPQAKTCAACPQNRWGSRITDSGKKAKACSDSRRVAVVPAGDLANDVYGGPMMLRVPPASLNDLSVYNKRLAQKNINYNRIVTRLGFDLNTAYPKLTFKAVRVLDIDELNTIAEHFRDSSVLERILEMPMEESTDAVPAQESATVDVELEVQPEPDKPKVVKKKAVKKAAAKKAEPEPVKQEAAADDGLADALDNELDDLLSDLDNLS